MPGPQQLAPREGASPAFRAFGTVQELLRHANSRITLEVYTQAVTANKRAAQSKVVRMMVPNLGENQEESHPGMGA